MENTRELFQILTRRIGLLNKNCCGVDGIEVSVAQSHILYEIDRNHQPSIQQIADALGMDVTTISRQIQTLVDMELVIKTPYMEDRRIQILSLSEKGKRVAAYIDGIMEGYFQEVFSNMTPFEKETVLRSIQLLNHALLQSKSCCSPMG